MNRSVVNALCGLDSGNLEDLHVLSARECLFSLMKYSSNQSVDSFILLQKGGYVSTIDGILEVFLHCTSTHTKGAGNYMIICFPDLNETSAFLYLLAVQLISSQLQQTQELRVSHSALCSQHEKLALDKLGCLVLTLYNTGNIFTNGRTM